MKKREFIKLSSALVTGSVLSPLVDWSQDKPLTNWAGNFSYSTKNLQSPKTIDEVQALVKKLDKLKVLGTRHCFNRIADSKANLVSLAHFDEVIDLDKKAHTVTVGSGIRYGKLAEYLNKNGFALHNLASLPHISVAGACATATHGSGRGNGNLSTAVRAIEMINGRGELVTLSRDKDGEQFLGAVVGLGGLGVVTKVTLDIKPTFNIRQVVYENLSFGQLGHHFDDIMSSGYSVSLFTDWENKNISEVWVKQLDEPGASIKPEFYGAKAATKNLHPIITLSAENCTEQMGVPGPWHERLPHFKMGFTPSSGKELQSEYFVPYHHAYEAMLAVEKLHAQISPHLFITEIRTIKEDNLWMSTCYKRSSATIHFTWKPEWAAVKKLLPMIESQLAPFNPRPHWGKLFTMAPQTLKSRYEKLPEFRQLLAHHDPKGKFRNEFLDTNIYG